MHFDLIHLPQALHRSAGERALLAPPHRWRPRRAS